MASKALAIPKSPNLTTAFAVKKIFYINIIVISIKATPLSVYILPVTSNHDEGYYFDVHVLKLNKSVQIFS